MASDTGASSTLRIIGFQVRESHLYNSGCGPNPKSLTSDWGQRPYCRFGHELIQGRAWLVDARRIDEDELRCIVGQDAQLALAGRLWFGRDDGNFLAQIGIHQRRLAHVGPTKIL